MIIIEHNQLGYLHDALVTSMVWTPSSDGIRNLTLNIICNNDCEYNKWSNKNMVLTFVDILFAQGTFIGCLREEETIYDIIIGVSPTVDKQLQELTSIGLSEPSMLLTVTFNSGAKLEAACAHIELSID